MLSDLDVPFRGSVRARCCWILLLPFWFVLQSKFCSDRPNKGFCQGMCRREVVLPGQVLGVSRLAIKISDWSHLSIGTVVLLLTLAVNKEKIAGVIQECGLLLSSGNFSEVVPAVPLWLLSDFAIYHGDAKSPIAIRDVFNYKMWLTCCQTRGGWWRLALLFVLCYLFMAIVT